MALIGAGANAIFAKLSLTDHLDEGLSPDSNPWIWLDAALLLILALFVFRRSRVAATFLFPYFVVVKAIQIHEDAVPRGVVVVAVLFGLYYFNAMRATYLWHMSYKN